MLPFQGVNVAGHCRQPSIMMEKDSSNDFLKNPKHNRWKFMLVLVGWVVLFFDVLTDDQFEKVLIFDDSTYDKARYKAVELLSWALDHNKGQRLKGFKLLTLDWSDRINILPLNFVLSSSTKLDKRAQRVKKNLAKRTCGYKRRIEAANQLIDHLETMFKRDLAREIRAD